ncbi:MAG TPA: hypothetical protein VMQ58_00990, partial [Candidatus Saccharimonadales bacterium]|nr:hypothetical protein [Candidatus Saccharimonadales bacterium]
GANLYIIIGIPERFTITGRFGWAITLLLMGTAAFLGVAAGSILLGLAGIFASLVAAFYLGWLNLSSSTSIATGWFGALIAISILVLLSMRRRFG